MATEYDVFVSYDWQDHAQVELIARRLREDHQLEPFLDRWYLPAGQPWPQLLEQALRDCRAVAVCIGPGEMGPWQQREIYLAQERQGHTPGFPVIPVLLPGADPVLGFLGANTWVDLRQGVDQPLIIAILAGATRGQPPGPDLQGRIAQATATICPYRGLLYFREEDARFFFGRDAAIADLRTAVERHSLVAVVGASGSGKSSVVRAGLIPTLRRDRERIWDIITIVPTGRPLHALAAGLLQLLEPDLPEVQLVAQVNLLAEHFSDGTVKVRDVVERLLNKQSGTQRLLLLVDQWEELVTENQNSSVRRNFIDNILEATEQTPLSVVLTLRGDFVGSALLSHRELSDRVQNAQVNIGPLTHSELMDMIDKPARELGLEFEPGLQQRIRDAVGDEPGNLPLLEFVLKRLWETRSGSLMLHQAYDAMGELPGAIAHRAEEVYNRLTAEEQAEAKHVFSETVRLGENQQDTRRRVDLRLLGVAAREVVRKLANERLLVTARDPGSGSETVEIAHEALIHNWGLLRGWINDNRAFLLWRERLRLLLAEWKGDSGDPGALLRGSVLAEALRWSEKYSDQLSPDESSYIKASHDRQIREEKLAEQQSNRLIAQSVAIAEEHERATTRARIVVCVVLVAAIGLGYLAWIATRARRIAVSRELAGNAALLRDIDPELSLHLALEALRITPTFEAERSFRNALIVYHESHLRAVFEGHSGSVRWATFDPKGRYVATASEDGTVALWNSDGGEPLRRFVVDTKGEAGSNTIVYQANFSPDGSTLVSASQDGRMRAWSTITGELKFDVSAVHPVSPVDRPAALRSAAFSHDGHRIVTASEDRLVSIWDADTGEKILELSGACEHSDILYNAVFSPDGSLVATASRDKTIRVLNASSGELVWELSSVEQKPFRSAVFSPQGDLLLGVGESNTAPIWDIAKRTIVGELSGHAQLLRSAAFSPNGDLIATASGDHMVRIYKASTQKLALPPFSTTGSVNSVQFSPDGSSLLTSSGDNVARLWAINPGIHRVALQVDSTPVRSVAFSPDGKWVATAGEDGTARVWNKDGKSPIFQGKHENGWISSVGFSPDGSQLVTAGTDKTARIWNLRTRQQQYVLRGHEGWVYSAAFSPNGLVVVSVGQDGVARIWNADDGSSLASCRGHRGRVTGVAFRRSGDSSLFATAGEDGSAKIWNWNLTGCTPVVSINTHHGWAYSVALSPDGKRLVTGGEDGMVRIWDSSSGAMIKELKGHEGWIFRVTWDGNRIVSASEDGTARVWDPDNGRQISAVPGSAGWWVYSAEIAHDGDQIALASEDGSVLIYGPEFLSPIESLSDVAKGLRKLTQLERQTYLHEKPASTQ